MAQKKTTQPSEPEVKPSIGLFKSAKRGLITVLVVLVILYGGLLLLSTTDGFRKMRADALSELLKTTVKIDSCHFDPLLRLNLKGLKIGDASSLPIATVDQIILGYDLTRGVGHIRSIDLDGGEFNLMRSTPVSDGMRSVYALWNPLAEIVGFYRPLTSSLDLNTQVHLSDPEWLMDFSRVKVTNFNLIERDASGQIVLSFTQSLFNLAEVNIPDRDYRYFRFALEQFTRSDGAGGPIEVEWMQGDDLSTQLSVESPGNRSQENRTLITNSNQTEASRYLLDSESRTRVRIPAPRQ